ncbi:MAG: hypothetical protein QXI16_05195 [Sulfolobaceae archaeon]
MGIITSIIAAVGAWLTGILGFVTDAIEGIVAVFYDGTDITVVGALLMFGLAFGLVMFAFNFIRGFIRK